MQSSASASAAPVWKLFVTRSPQKKKKASSKSASEASSDEDTMKSLPQVRLLWSGPKGTAPDLATMSSMTVGLSAEDLSELAVQVMQHAPANSVGSLLTALACASTRRPIPGGETVIDLNAFNQVAATAKKAVCGKVFKKGDIVWQCRQCGKDTACVQCDPCFRNSNHVGHEVYFHRSTGGTAGCCDCGDPEAWLKQGNCCDHSPPTDAGQNLKKSAKKASDDDKETNGDDDSSEEEEEEDPLALVPPALQRTFRAVLNGVFAQLSAYLIAFARGYTSNFDSNPYLGLAETVFPEEVFQFLILNDDVHSYQDVIRAFQRYGFNPMKAQEFTQKIDKEGSIAVLSSVDAVSNDSLRKAFHIFKEHAGLHVSILPQRLVASEPGLLAALKWCLHVGNLHPGLQRILAQEMNVPLDGGASNFKSHRIPVVTAVKLEKVAGSASAGDSTFYSSDEEDSESDPYRAAAYKNYHVRFLANKHNHANSHASGSGNHLMFPHEIAQLSGLEIVDLGLSQPVSHRTSEASADEDEEVESGAPNEKAKATLASPDDDFRSRIRFPFMYLPQTPMSVWLCASPFITQQMVGVLHDFIMKFQYDLVFKASFSQCVSMLYPTLMLLYHDHALGTRQETILRNTVQVYTAQTVIRTLSTSKVDTNSPQDVDVDVDDEIENEEILVDSILPRPYPEGPFLSGSSAEAIENGGNQRLMNLPAMLLATFLTAMRASKLSPSTKSTSLFDARAFLGDVAIRSRRYSQSLRDFEYVVSAGGPLYALQMFDDKVNPGVVGIWEDASRLLQHLDSYTRLTHAHVEREDDHWQVAMNLIIELQSALAHWSYTAYLLPLKEKAGSRYKFHTDSLLKDFRPYLREMLGSASVAPLEENEILTTSERDFLRLLQTSGECRIEDLHFLLKKRSASGDDEAGLDQSLILQHHGLSRLYLTLQSLTLSNLGAYLLNSLATWTESFFTAVETNAVTLLGQRIYVPKVMVSKSPVSIHLPLHRYLAQVVYAASMTENVTVWPLLAYFHSEDKGLYSSPRFLPLQLDDEEFLQIIDLPIRALVFASQVRQGMWRRNGQATANLALNYQVPVLSRLYRDLDLLLVQIACATYSRSYRVTTISDRTASLLDVPMGPLHVLGNSAPADVYKAPQSNSTNFTKTLALLAARCEIHNILEVAPSLATGANTLSFSYDTAMQLSEFTRMLLTIFLDLPSPLVCYANTAPNDSVDISADPVLQRLKTDGLFAAMAREAFHLLLTEGSHHTADSTVNTAALLQQRVKGMVGATMRTVNDTLLADVLATLTSDNSQASSSSSESAGATTVATATLSDWSYQLYDPEYRNLDTPQLTYALDRIKERYYPTSKTSQRKPTTGYDKLGFHPKNPHQPIIYPLAVSQAHPDFAGIRRKFWGLNNSSAVDPEASYLAQILHRLLLLAMQLLKQKNTATGTGAGAAANSTESVTGPATNIMGRILQLMTLLLYCRPGMGSAEEDSLKRFHAISPHHLPLIVTLCDIYCDKNLLFAAEPMFHENAGFLLFEIGCRNSVVKEQIQQGEGGQRNFIVEPKVVVKDGTTKKTVTKKAGATGGAKKAAGAGLSAQAKALKMMASAASAFAKDMDGDDEDSDDEEGGKKSKGKKKMDVDGDEDDEEDEKHVCILCKEYKKGVAKGFLGFLQPSHTQKHLMLHSQTPTVGFCTELEGETSTQPDLDAPAQLFDNLYRVCTPQGAVVFDSFRGHHLLSVSEIAEFKESPVSAAALGKKATSRKKRSNKPQVLGHVPYGSHVVVLQRKDCWAQVLYSQQPSSELSEGGAKRIKGWMLMWYSVTAEPPVPGNEASPSNSAENETVAATEATTSIGTTTPQATHGAFQLSKYCRRVINVLHPVKDLLFQRHGGTRLHVSSCGHAMHYPCFDEFFSASFARTLNQPGNEHFWIDIERGESLCPLCKTITNVLVPLPSANPAVPGSSEGSAVEVSPAKSDGVIQVKDSSIQSVVEKLLKHLMRLSKETTQGMHGQQRNNVEDIRFFESLLNMTHYLSQHGYDYNTVFSADKQFNFRDVDRLYQGRMMRIRHLSSAVQAISYTITQSVVKHWKFGVTSKSLQTLVQEVQGPNKPSSVVVSPSVKLSASTQALSEHWLQSLVPAQRRAVQTWIAGTIQKALESSSLPWETQTISSDASLVHMLVTLLQRSATNLFHVPAETAQKQQESSAAFMYHIALPFLWQLFGRETFGSLASSPLTSSELQTIPVPTPFSSMDAWIKAASTVPMLSMATGARFPDDTTLVNMLYKLYRHYDVSAVSHNDSALLKLPLGIWHFLNGPLLSMDLSVVLTTAFAVFKPASSSTDSAGQNAFAQSLSIVLQTLLLAKVAQTLIEPQCTGLLVRESQRLQCFVNNQPFAAASANIQSVSAEEKAARNAFFTQEHSPMLMDEDNYQVDRRHTNNHNSSQQPRKRVKLDDHDNAASPASSPAADRLAARLSNMRAVLCAEAQIPLCAGDDFVLEGVALVDYVLGALVPFLEIMLRLVGAATLSAQKSNESNSGTAAAAEGNSMDVDSDEDDLSAEGSSLSQASTAIDAVSVTNAALWLYSEELLHRIDARFSPDSLTGLSLTHVLLANNGSLAFSEALLCTWAKELRDFSPPAESDPSFIPDAAASSALLSADISKEEETELNPSLPERPPLSLGMLGRFASDEGIEIVTQAPTINTQLATLPPAPSLAESAELTVENDVAAVIAATETTTIATEAVAPASETTAAVGTATAAATDAATGAAETAAAPSDHPPPTLARGYFDEGLDDLDLLNEELDEDVRAAALRTAFEENDGEDPTAHTTTALDDVRALLSAQMALNAAQAAAATANLQSQQHLLNNRQANQHQHHNALAQVLESLVNQTTTQQARLEALPNLLRDIDTNFNVGAGTLTAVPPRDADANTDGDDNGNGNDTSITPDTGSVVPERPLTLETAAERAVARFAQRDALTAELRELRRSFARNMEMLMMLMAASNNHITAQQIVNGEVRFEMGPPPGAGGRRRGADIGLGLGMGTGMAGPGTRGGTARNLFDQLLGTGRLGATDRALPPAAAAPPTPATATMTATAVQQASTAAQPSAPSHARVVIAARNAWRMYGLDPVNPWIDAVSGGVVPIAGLQPFVPQYHTPLQGSVSGSYAIYSLTESAPSKNTAVRKHADKEVSSQVFFDLSHFNLRLHHLLSLPRSSVAASATTSASTKKSASTVGNNASRERKQKTTCLVSLPLLYTDLYQACKFPGRLQLRAQRRPRSHSLGSNSGVGRRYQMHEKLDGEGDDDEDGEEDDGGREGEGEEVGVEEEDEEGDDDDDDDGEGAVVGVGAVGEGGAAGVPATDTDFFDLTETGGTDVEAGDGTAAGAARNALAGATGLDALLQSLLDGSRGNAAAGTADANAATTPAAATTVADSVLDDTVYRQNASLADPALCLICGHVFAAGRKITSNKSSATGHNVDLNDTYDLHPPGECTLHALSCGAGTGIFFLVHSGIVLLCRGGRSITQPSLYVDRLTGSAPNAGGSGRSGWHSGEHRPLYLAEEKLQELEAWYLQHRVAKEVTRKRTNERSVIRLNWY